MVQATNRLDAEPPVIRLVAENLAKKFNTEWLFRDFNYRFDANTIYAITGPNGSGKSTLLQILWGQMPSTAGLIRYEVAGMPVENDEMYNHIAIATPYLDLIDELSLNEQVDFHFRLKPILPGFTAKQVIHNLYLDDAADKPIGNFSSGMKQRLKLGLAFYTDVPAVFLDEPGTNLDTKAFAWYQNLLATHSKNRLVIIASNNKEEYPVHTRIIAIDEFKPKPS
ncbi:MAG: ATP-binding cassette domain-containing protein [Cyclobacteriaceae bacterium]